jgi:peroxiredoxin family protein
MEDAVAEATARRRKATICVFSGDMDKVFAALSIAAGAAASGMDTIVFFTFWGLRAIEKGTFTGKSLLPRLLGLINRGGIDRLSPSRYSFGGAGRWLFKRMMQDKGVAPLADMMEATLELGARFLACETSMTVMEIGREDLIDAVSDVVGVATFVQEAADSDFTLFIS